MIITINDIVKGQEIMLAQGCKFIIARVLREPTLRYRKVDGQRVPVLKSWGPHRGEHLYSTVKCEVKTVERSRKGYGDSIFKWKEIDNTLPEYNDAKYFDLNFREIWINER